MYVCMCVCVYVCMYVCMDGYIYIYRKNKKYSLSFYSFICSDYSSMFSLITLSGSVAVNKHQLRKAHTKKRVLREELSVQT